MKTPRVFSSAQVRGVAARTTLIFVIGLLWSLLLPGVGGYAAGAPAARPPGEGEAAANVRVVAPPPATPSKFDSEPIRRATGSDGASSSSSANSPARPQGLELPRLGAALAAVIALILLLRWGGRKLFSQPGVGKSNGAVQVLSRSPLSTRQSVLLLRVGKRVIVVGDSGSQMNALAEITDPDEVAALVGQVRESRPEFSAKSFGSLFNRARREMNAGEESSGITEEKRAADMPDASEAEIPLDPTITKTRDDLSGLMEKVRQLSQNMRSTRT